MKYLLTFEGKPDSICEKGKDTYTSILPLKDGDFSGTWIYQDQIKDGWEIRSVTELEINLLIIGGYNDI